MIKFRQSQALTSHFESFWSILQLFVYLPLPQLQIQALLELTRWCRKQHWSKRTPLWPKCKKWQWLWGDFWLDPAIPQWQSSSSSILKWQMTDVMTWHDINDIFHDTMTDNKTIMTECMQKWVDWYDRYEWNDNVIEYQMTDIMS